MVFTEHGAVMLASVLNSPRAVETSNLVFNQLLLSEYPHKENLKDSFQKSYYPNNIYE